MKIDLSDLYSKYTTRINTKFLERLLYSYGGIALIIYLAPSVIDNFERDVLITDYLFSVALFVIPIGMIFKSYSLYRKESTEEKTQTIFLDLIKPSTKKEITPKTQTVISDIGKQKISHYLKVLGDFKLFDKHGKDDSYFYTILENTDLADEEHLHLSNFVDVVAEALEESGENVKDYLTGIFYFAVKSDVPLYDYEKILPKIDHISKGFLNISGVIVEDTTPEKNANKGDIHFTENGKNHTLKYVTDSEFSIKYINVKPLGKINTLLKQKKKGASLVVMYKDESAYIACIKDKQLNSLNKAISGEHWEVFETIDS